ncbi:MAG: DUF3137 domain-containing protein [Acholeplasmatales bacterium]|jgi:hypothetical protein|nr:DUF3137 domain-containing protein [Acholeplasmatales bacterium]
MDNLNETFENIRIEKYKRYKKYIFLMFSFLGLTVIGFFITLFTIIFGNRQNIFLIILPFVSFTLPIVPTIVFGAMAIVTNYKFSKNVKSQALPEMLKTVYKNSCYELNGGIPLKDILMTKMVYAPSNHKSEDYIKGIYNNIFFESCDLTLKTTSTDGQGHTTETVYFNGLWIILKKIRNENNSVLVLERGFPSGSMKGLEKAEVEGILFNKKFKIYATSKFDAFYVLKPVLLEKLVALEEEHKGTIAFGYVGKDLHIGINDFKNHFEFSIKKPLTSENVALFRTNIDIFKDLIDIFKLRNANDESI